jgi:hypothetical protein
LYFERSSRSVRLTKSSLLDERSLSFCRGMVGSSPGHGRKGHAIELPRAVRPR